MGIMGLRLKILLPAADLSRFPSGVARELKYLKIVFDHLALFVAQVEHFIHRLIYPKTRIYPSPLSYLPLSHCISMSLFGEFHVPSDAFAFHETFQVEPDMVIEIERVVATDELLTPYFWVSNISSNDFETATTEDETVEGLRRLDEYDEATLYRAEWTDRIETLVYAYTHIGATILDAEGKSSEWQLRMRFDDREKLSDFNEYLNDNGISFDLQRLYEITHPRSGSQFGLTRKQTEALTTAWEMGYFALPREATTEEVAEELGIAPQSLSDLLRRAENVLIENTLRVQGPTEHDFSGNLGS